MVCTLNTVGYEIDKPEIDVWVTPAPDGLKLPDGPVASVPFVGTWVAFGTSRAGSEWLLEHAEGSLSAQWYSIPAWLEFDRHPSDLVAAAHSAGLTVESDVASG